MTVLEVDRESLEEVSSWEEETSIDTEEASVAMEVLGQNRNVAVSSASRAVSYLDYPELALVFKTEAAAEDGDMLDRVEEYMRRKQQAVKQSEENGGFRDEEFYESYYNLTVEEVEKFSTRIEIVNLEAVAGQAIDIQVGMDNHPEYDTGPLRFGTGFENRIMALEDVQDAVAKLEDNLGFQVLFQYSGDAEAVERYSDYQSSNPLTANFDEEGVTGVVCLGRQESPEVYMAGPEDLSVEMEGLPGYDGDFELNSLISIH